jgi:hypothetical protein
MVVYKTALAAFVEKASRYEREIRYRFRLNFRGLYFPLRCNPIYWL